jgi:hypothetical protein
MGTPPKKILDQMRDAIRLKHYAYRTEKTYIDWVYRFILFHNKRHPREMGAPEIEAFLTSETDCRARWQKNAKTTMI